jgi:NTP-dependent ternary system trypsin peptidase co-occuring protein
MPYFVEVPVDGQQSIVVDAGELPEGSIVQAGRARDVTAAAVQSVEMAADGIKAAAGAFVDKLRSLEQSPKEIAIEFGVQLATAAGVVIASTTAQANVKVTVRWTRD